MLLPYKGFIYLSNDFLRNKLIMTKSLQNVETFHRLLCSSIMTININTLSRADFISTELQELVYAPQHHVSMPYLGRTSFLHDFMKQSISRQVRVNALSRAHFISTIRALARHRAPRSGCQCPISGALHFYGRSWRGGIGKRMCQCPISGALHFYKKTA